MQQRRILLVCDDSGVAGELEGQLASLGHETVAIARSGGEAIDMSVELAPDVVLLDGAISSGVQPGARTSARSGSDRGPLVMLLPGVNRDSPTGSTQAGPGPRMSFSDHQLQNGIEMALSLRDAAGSGRAFDDRFFEISIDMLCILNFDGYFSKLNPAWERTLGFSREELMSRPFIEFVHPDDRQRTLEQNRRSRQGEQSLGFENRYLCRDGTFRWFHWNAAPDHAGGMIYSMARDVTARKLAEEDRDQLVRELQGALAEVRALREILPICSYCRKIRDDKDYWQTVESYISEHTRTRFSHGICPSCMESELGSMSHEAGKE